MTDNTAVAGAPAVASDVAWHTLDVAEAASRLGMDPVTGLSADQARQRLQEHGPNALAETEPVPLWKKFLKHYRDYMQIVLVVAAVVSFLIGE